MSSVVPGSWVDWVSMEGQVGRLGGWMKVFGRSEGRAVV